MRTYARNRTERTIQVLRWAMDHFEVKPGTVRVEFVDVLEKDKKGEESLFGYVTKVGGKDVIRLSMRANDRRSVMIETALHEFAHVLYKRSHLHPDNFWLTFGKIYRAFHEEGGKEASLRYPVD